MVLHIRRRLWRRTEAEFDGPESVTFIERPRHNVLLMGMEFEPTRGDVLGNMDELGSPPCAPFTGLHVEPVNRGPLHRQGRHDALIQRGHPERTVWSDDAIEDPTRLLKGERLPRREEGIRSHACTMPHCNHGSFVSRLKCPNGSM